MGCSLGTMARSAGRDVWEGLGAKVQSALETQEEYARPGEKAGSHSTFILLGLSPLTSPPSPTSAPAGADRVRQEPGARSKGTSQMGCNRPSMGSLGRGRASECEEPEDRCPGLWMLTVQSHPSPCSSLTLPRGTPSPHNHPEHPDVPDDAGPWGAQGSLFLIHSPSLDPLKPL